MPRQSPDVLQALAAVAPGSPLRDGLDRIVSAKMGALVVVGDGPEVLNFCSGGFLLDAPYSPQRLSELAKMDGAIILAADASRIARANVHLLPPTRVPTSETGTRHRTAERMARSVDVPVISISEDMGVIAVWVNDYKHTVEDITRQLSRANRALATLERYVARLGEVTGMLASLEVEDLVTGRDVAGVLQRAEMVYRISEEIRAAIVELGADGRLVGLQLDEVLGDSADHRPAVVADYVRDPGALDTAMVRLAELPDNELVDLRCVGVALGYDDLDEQLQSRGYRMLARVPRLSEETAGRVVERFVTLQQLMRASVADLVAVDGVDAREAKSIKDGLARITESSILDRYA